MTMKTLKVNFFAMTALLVCCFMVLESCRKEPIDDKDGGWCGTTDPNCNMSGTVTFLPTQCLTNDVSNVMGIVGDDGSYYMINKDQTGRFDQFKDGDRVKFGLKDKSESCIVCFACDCPNPDYCITLTCINGSHNDPGPPTCGFGECSIPAKVVSYTMEGSDYQSVGNLVKIDGKHYKVIGNASQDVEDMQPGTEILVSYGQPKTDCYLPAVITSPNIDGCVELTCINEKLIIRTN